MTQKYALWQNKIVRYAEFDPAELVAHPQNWRQHPKLQSDAMEGVLTEVGWVAPVIVNDRTGHMLDGHLRVSRALSRNQPTVPVLYVDLSEAEELEILATFDPLSAMAAKDADQLAALLDQVSSGETAVQAMLDQLAQDAGITPMLASSAENADINDIPAQFMVIVECRTEHEQVALLQRFMDEGLSCRALTS